MPIDTSGIAENALTLIILILMFFIMYAGITKKYLGEIVDDIKSIFGGG
jgi:hypothetical protein